MRLHSFLFLLFTLAISGARISGAKNGKEENAYNYCKGGSRGSATVLPHSLEFDGIMYLKMFDIPFELYF